MRLVVLLIGAIFSSPALAQNPAAHDCGFDITFPAPVEAFSDTLSTDGVDSLVRWNLSAREETAVFGVMCQVVAAPIPRASRNAILRNAPSSFRGKVVEEEQITIDGEPGLAFTIQVSEQAPYMYNRAYVTDRAIFILSVGDVALEPGEEPEAFVEFFDSFTLRQ